MTQHPPAPSPEEEELSEEQQANKALEEDVSRQDVAQINVLLQFAGAFALYKTEKFVALKNAFETLKDRKLKNKLLDFENPQECQMARHSIRIADKQLRKKGVPQAQAEAKFLFSRTKITREEFTRATYATAIARKAHRAVNARSVEIKIQNHLNRFGFGQEESPKLKASINALMKEHPGLTVDDTLIVETRKIYREQGKKLSKKEEKELRREYQQSRQKAVEELKDTVIKRSNEAVEYLLAPKISTTSLEDLHLANKHLETGQEIIIPPQEPQASPASQPQVIPISTPAPSARPKAITPPSLPPVQAIRPPALSRTQSRFFSPLKKLRSRILAVPNFNAFNNKLKNAFLKVAFIHSVRTAVRNFAAYSLLALRRTALRKFITATTWNAFKTLLGVGSLGTSFLIFGALEIVKRIPILGNVLSGMENALFKFVKYAAIFAVAVPVGIFLFTLLMLNSKASNVTPYYGSENALKLKASTSSGGSLQSWAGFEREFLTIKKLTNEKTELSNSNWRQFEKENLIPEQKQLSLDQFIRN